jgi:hypothetical protein
MSKIKHLHLHGGYAIYTPNTCVYINIQRLISIHPKHVMLTYVESFSSIILTFVFGKIIHESWNSSMSV